jgi:hypothetical protein
VVHKFTDNFFKLEIYLSFFVLQIFNANGSAGEDQIETKEYSRLGSQKGK